MLEVAKVLKLTLFSVKCLKSLTPAFSQIFPVTPIFFHDFDNRYQGGFPVIAEITRIFAANSCRQFFFVITTTASTRCLVQNFQLICYSQQVNATSQYNHSGSSKCSKWPNDRMVAVVKHCWLLIQGRRDCRER